MLRALLLLLAVVAAYAQSNGGSFAPSNMTDLSATSGVTLTANITVLQTAPAWVKVSWTGRQNPSPYDAVAFVVPATGSYNTTPPFKFFWAQSDPNYLATGAGSAVFHVLNHRASFRFIFVTQVQDWLGNFTLLAETPIIPLATPNQPTQIHLYYSSNDTTEITAQWTTTNRTQDPIVRWGTQPGVYTFQANGSTDTYTRSELCGSTASHAGYFFPGWFNSAPMGDLEPATRYYYSVGSEEPGFQWSPEYSFLTAEAVGPDSSVSLLFLADLGFCEIDGSIEWPGFPVNNASTVPPGTPNYLSVEVYNALNHNEIEPCACLATAQLLNQEIQNRTLTIHAGDLGYWYGNTYGVDVYMDMLAPLLASAPYMIVQGNHEQDYGPSGVGRFPTATDSGGECGVIASKQFPMPQADFWYSFATGPIHFTAWDTELEYGAGSPQYNFILKDVQSVNRSLTPWLVSYYHRPFYTDNWSGNTVAGDVNTGVDQRSAFEQIFMTYQVDQTWYGHVHQYSRTCEIYQEVCQPRDGNNSATAPVHVLLGNAGQTYTLYQAPVTPEYYEVVAIQHGYMRVQANRTTMHMEVVNSATGQLTDAWTMTKPVGWAPNKTAQATTINDFVSNYTESTWEQFGIGGGIDLVQGAAQTMLLADPTLLATLRNTSYISNPDAPETMALDDVYYTALEMAYELHIAGTPAETPQVKLFWTQFFQPSWARYLANPDGLLKGPELGSAFPGAGSNPATAG